MNRVHRCFYSDESDTESDENERLQNHNDDNENNGTGESDAVTFDQLMKLLGIFPQQIITSNDRPFGCPIIYTDRY